MEKRRKKQYPIIAAATAAVLLLSYLVNDAYYRNLLETAGVEEETGKICKYQFAMIVDTPGSDFWQAVYAGGKQTAEASNVLLELKGADRDSEYDKLDYMNMSIAAQVDGIILENNGEKGLADKINEAVEKGIPVVTVMGDASYSQRQSFVGVSDYQMGATYGEQVAAYLDENTEDILILTRRNLDDLSQSQIYNQIHNAALQSSAHPKRLNVTVQNLLTTGPFDAEEAIRDIFQQEEGPPDMLVCMDGETTECARQALIDFNMAEEVKIIGCYISESILDAVAKGLICATCNVDTTQLGRYSVQALVDYKEEGRVNSYINADVDFIDMEQAKSLERRARNEKISME